MNKYLKISVYLGSGVGGVSILMMFMGVYNFIHGSVIFLEWELYSFHGASLIMVLLLDWMSMIFMGFVLMISSVVLLYSTNYMANEINFSRFIWLVFLFVLSMVFLILSPNMVSILLGWDGLGLVSYCLVIYYQNVKSANAGMLTILSNRVGDVAILLCISWMFNYGSWNFYYLPYMILNSELSMVTLLVVLAAMTKSAQVPFSAWLPAAMAAPTPVSSLVHSSTLVTAGVYLLIRFSSLIGVSLILLLISVLTMVMSGVNANLEMDLKKVIALSTLSQLGVMMMSISLGLTEMAFFHLLSHALFKSLLFLCAGVIIHGMGDIQDIRDLGGVSTLIPVTSLYFLGCSLSLCGFPFLSGFYSKDLIIEVYLMSGGLNWLIYLLIMTSVLLTSIYSTRLACVLFLKPLAAKKLNNLCEESFMTIPMSLLFYTAVMGGSCLIWGFSPPLLICAPVFIKLFVLVMVLALMTFGVLLSAQMNFVSNLLNVEWIHFFGGMLMMPNLSTVYVIPKVKLGLKLVKFLDQGWTEALGGQGIFMKMSRVYSSSYNLNYLNLKLYLFLFLTGVVIVLFF